MQLTVKDVARLLEVSEKSVYRWIDDGKLPGYRISGQYRFNRSELLAWATAQKIHVSPQVFLEPESASAALGSFADALRAGGVHYRIGGSDRDSCLRGMIQTLPLPEEVDREFLYQVLLAREKIEPTGVGGGVAIPHLRNPIVLHLGRPVLAVCFLERPADFGALDGKPVRVLFPLITPTVKSHLYLLSRLTFALKDPGFKALLDKVAERDSILARAQALSDRFDASVRSPRPARAKPQPAPAPR